MHRPERRRTGPVAPDGGWSGYGPLGPSPLGLRPLGPSPLGPSRGLRHGVRASAAVRCALVVLLVVALAVSAPQSALTAGASRAAFVPLLTVEATSCTVSNFDRVAGRAAPAGFTRAQCAQGLALAAGPQDLGLFRDKQGTWTAVKMDGSDALAGANPLEFAGVEASPTLLDQLARPFGVPVRRLVGAGALVVELARHETALKAEGAYQASPVVSAHGQNWFVLAGADATTATDGSVTQSPYPDGTVSIYRWSPQGWSRYGVVRGWLGPIGGCCGISAVSLTGSAAPDFAIMGGGAADTNWLAIVSDAGRHWHLVPFDYGYSDTTVVNGEAAPQGVYTEVDASSSAGGPTTELFETYRAGVFRPARPPGASAPCTLSALQTAADPGQLAVLVLTHFACADGWAVAIGTGAGFTGQVVGLFEAGRSNWSTIELDNGASLGSDPGIYDIPLSLLEQLTAGLGAGVRPALATAALIAAPAITDWLYVNGVISADGGQWYVDEKPTGNVDAPGADAVVYRWSGSTWLKEGRVAHVPPSLNYFRALSGGWFEAVSVPGTSDPAFVMESAGSPSRALLTDAGGPWHVAPYPPPTS